MVSVRFLSVVLAAAVCLLQAAEVETTDTAAQSITKKTAGKSQDTLVVTARLVEIPGRFPPNDAYNYVYVMKYRVISVESGEYSEKDLYVGHYNPLIPRKLIKDDLDPFVDGTVESFSVGAKQRLVLVEPIDKFYDQKEDEYYDTELPKYFAVQADYIK
jgi:hypothetical protein